REFSEISLFSSAGKLGYPRKVPYVFLLLGIFLVKTSPEKVGRAVNEGKPQPGQKGAGEAALSSHVALGARRAWGPRAGAARHVPRPRHAPAPADVTLLRLRTGSVRKAGRRPAARRNRGEQRGRVLWSGDAFGQLGEEQRKCIPLVLPPPAPAPPCSIALARLRCPSADEAGLDRSG